METYYKEILRLTEGNKRLARSTEAYFKRQKKLTQQQWRDELKPLMVQAESEIIDILKNQNISTWQASNLRNILANIQSVVMQYDRAFKNAMPSSMEASGDLSMRYTDKNMLDLNITPPVQNTVLTRQVVESIFPLTETFITNFTDDMYKILRGEISLGIIQNKTIAEVADSIQKKFKSSNMSYARAERIATTEMLRSASMVQNARGLEIKEVVPETKKRWINAHKPNSRITHLQTESDTADKPIGLDEMFNVGGEQAMYPHDPSLSAKNTVYCACTVIYVIPDQNINPKIN